ncbi:MAG TPA: CBS domain-containing protein [Gemmatimonadaceae bacterium]|nr:CBS domain-containing protein [Gemmatimonadaceae bacterium]
MQAKEIMSRDPQCCTPGDTLQSAARMMADFDCGSLPVVESADRKELIGVLTDRDIAIRGVAKGKTPDSKVNDVMTPAPASCSPEDDVDEVERIMVEQQVRRVPVVDADRRVVGMIAQADLARDNRAASDRDVGRIVEKISEPTTAKKEPPRDKEQEYRL